VVWKEEKGEEEISELEGNDFLGNHKSNATFEISLSFGGVSARTAALGSIKTIFSRWRMRRVDERATLKVRK